MKHWRWKRWENRIPALIPSTLRQICYRSVRRRDVDLNPAVQYLRPILQQYTRELCQLAGRDFPEWTTLYDRCNARPEFEPALADWLS
jgi:hypothetical protein